MRRSGRAPSIAAALVLFACALFACALSGCTLTSEPYDPRVIEAEETQEAPLEPRPPAVPVQDPATDPSNTTPNQPSSTEQLPPAVELDPGDTGERMLGAGQSTSDAGTTSAAGAPPGRDEPDAGAAPEPVPEPEPEPVVCPGSTFGASCYEFFGALRDWNTAEASCVTWGGHLVSVQSSDEQAFLGGWPLELGLPVGNGAGLWLGGADTAQDDNFRWSDGSAFTFPGWAPGQPNDGVGAADCVEKRNDGSTGWFDRRCTDQLAYVCEKPL